MFIDVKNNVFKASVNGTYVDKSELIADLNSLLDNPRRFLLFSRSRRFGKTYTIRMLNAYYSKRCESKEIFDKLKIADDPTYLENLNKYNVLCLDMQCFASSQDKNGHKYLSNLHEKLTQTLVKNFPLAFSGPIKNDFPEAIKQVYDTYNEQFIVLIDEWDYALRVYQNADITKEYVDLLRSLFKDESCAGCFSLVYMTGILPIKRYDTESSLNNFKEYTMESPGKYAKYFGFTEGEVQKLCLEHNLSFELAKIWYDGYKLNGIDIYNPNSIMDLIESGEYKSYWCKTGSLDVVTEALKLDVGNVRQDLVALLSGAEIKPINFAKYNSDIKNLKESNDILAYLVHLGYLAYDNQNNRVYIPNNEVRLAIVDALKIDNSKLVIEKIKDSESFIKSLLALDEEKVAAYIEKIHNSNVSILTYNNEVALRYVVMMAMFCADDIYQNALQELQSGKGFADLVYVPQVQMSAAYPSLVIELKWNKDTQTALDQIKEKQYATALKQTAKECLLVGINYDVETKKHSCKIEKIKLDVDFQ